MEGRSSNDVDLAPFVDRLVDDVRAMPVGQARSMAANALASVTAPGDVGAILLRLLAWLDLETLASIRKAEDRRRLRVKRSGFFFFYFVFCFVFGFDAFVPLVGFCGDGRGSER